MTEHPREKIRRAHLEQVKTAEAAFEERSKVLSAVPWEPMETAPQTGEPIEVQFEDGSTKIGYWRKTRKFNGRVWEPTAYWSNFVPSWIPFEKAPTGWRPRVL